jgi:hypothetical protein
MFTNFLISLIEKLLRGSLTAPQRNRLVIHILDIETALPIAAILTGSDEGILVNGELLDFEKARMMRDAAMRVLENQAFKLCADQVRYIAIKNGLATGLLPEDLLFYRAALWYADELKKHLALLAQEDTTIVRQLT